MTDINEDRTTSFGTTAQNTTQSGRDMASGLIAAIGAVLESTVHTVGNVGTTAALEAGRVLSTAAVGVRRTIGSAVSGSDPNFADMRQKDRDMRD